MPCLDFLKINKLYILLKCDVCYVVFLNFRWKPKLIWIRLISGSSRKSVLLGSGGKEGSLATFSASSVSRRQHRFFKKDQSIFYFLVRLSFHRVNIIWVLSSLSKAVTKVTWNCNFFMKWLQITQITLFDKEP